MPTYVITIEKVDAAHRISVRNAMRWGLPGRDAVMGLQAAHEVIMRGGVVAHTTNEADALTYGTALEDAGAVVNIREE